MGYGDQLGTDRLPACGANLPRRTPAETRPNVPKTKITPPNQLGICSEQTRPGESGVPTFFGNRNNCHIERLTADLLGVFLTVRSSWKNLRFL